MLGAPISRVFCEMWGPTTTTTLEPIHRFVLRARSHVCQKKANMGHPKVEHECISRELYFLVADVGHTPGADRHGGHGQQSVVCRTVEDTGHEIWIDTVFALIEGHPPVPLEAVCPPFSSPNI